MAAAKDVPFVRNKLIFPFQFLSVPVHVIIAARRFSPACLIEGVSCGTDRAGVPFVLDIRSHLSANGIQRALTEGDFLTFLTRNLTTLPDWILVEL